MRKAITINAIFIVLVIAFIIFLELLHAHLTQSPAANNTTPVNIKQVLSKDNVDSIITADTISINPTSFSPTSLTISVNTKVTWLNNDSVAHVITFAEGTPGSITVQPHGSSQLTFTTPTSYQYKVNGAGNETGTITVTDTSGNGLRKGG